MTNGKYILTRSFTNNGVKRTIYAANSADLGYNGGGFSPTHDIDKAIRFDCDTKDVTSDKGNLSDWAHLSVDPWEHGRFERKLFSEVV